MAKILYTLCRYQRVLFFLVFAKYNSLIVHFCNPPSQAMQNEEAKKKLWKQKWFDFD